MLRKIFQPKVCVALILVLLMVSICISPFAGVYFMGTPINTSTLLVITPILLGVVYAILISIETEPEKPSDKRKNGFAIAYAAVFTVFYIIGIWAIVYAILNGNW